MTPEEIETDLIAEASEPTSPAGMNEICIPSTSLEVGDDADKAAPEVGDSVDFAASGKVTRVEGGKTYMELATINGEPIKAPTPPEGPLSEEEQLDSDIMAEREPAFS